MCTLFFCIIVVSIGVLGTNVFTKLSRIFVLSLQPKDKIHFLVIRQTQYELLCRLINVYYIPTYAQISSVFLLNYCDMFRC